MPDQPVIDRALLEHLAELARLTMSADRQAALREPLQRLVDAFSALASDDAANADDARLALRDDSAEPPLPTATVLANAPQMADDSFVVPRVVEP
jgi:aspartyl-tRNA(Asn)/glutamyl-tRNA(Gln) amidotransferase subunit C